MEILESINTQYTSSMSLCVCDCSLCVLRVLVIIYLARSILKNRVQLLRLSNGADAAMQCQ